MCSNNFHLLQLEQSGKIVNIYLPEKDFHRAETDLVYAQELFNLHCKNNDVPKNLSNTEVQKVNSQHTTDGVQEETSSSTGAEQTIIIGNSTDFWSEAETLLFISLYENHKDDFSHAKKRKHVWTIIQEEMAAHNYSRDVEKLERKWTNLMRVYRSIKDSKGPKKTGRGAQNYKYYERIEEIVGDRPSNISHSSTILDVGINNEYVLANVNEESLETGSVKSCSGNDSDSTPKRRRQNEVLRLKKEKILQRERRHKEFMELEKAKLEMEQKKINLLEKYLDKLT